MKTSRLSAYGTGLPWRALLLSCVAVSTQAQQPAPRYSYPPGQGYSQPAPRYQNQAPTYPPQGYAQPEYQTEYVSPIEFLPTVGRKFGNMFRRVFYGDAPPAGYSPDGYPMPGSGQSLDTAPPSYQSHYGQPQPGGIHQPRYQQPQGYAQPQQQPGYAQPQQPVYPSPPRYQQAPQSQTQPGVPQYETPPPQRQSALPPAGSRPSVGTSSNTVKPSSKPKTTQSPPKKYIPPTITKKSTPSVEEMPPPPLDKKETAAASQTEYYPLPGGKPKTDAAKPSSSSSSTSKSAAGNTGAFLKGKRASKEGRVISPYPPYQELDVTGLSSGSLALDPTTQKVFEVP